MPHVLKFLLLNFVCVMAAGMAYFEKIGVPAYSIDDYLNIRSFLAQVLVLPFVETIVFQSMVIESVAWVGRTIFRAPAERYFLVLGVALSSVLFVLVHLLMNGLFNAVVFSVIGGISFASIYVINRGKGRQFAFASTWLLHTAVNGLFMLAFLFFSRLFS